MTTLGPSTTPGTYEFQVLDLLHDPNANRWTLAQIDGYINEARKKLCMDTGCLRTLQPSFISQGVEQYTYGQVSGASILTPGALYSAPTISFSGGGGTGVAATATQSGGAVNTVSFSTFGSGYTSAPTAVIADPSGSGATVQAGILSQNTLDVISVNVFWGTERYALRYKVWREFTIIYRPFTPQSYQRQPVCWSDYADNTIFIGPVPDQTYAVEWDTIILPTPFVSGDTTTQDQINVKSQDPIKFYAAYLAKKNAQNYGAAEEHLKDYNERMREVVGVYVGRIPDIYGS